ncbi:hypothetical protein AT5A_16386 [Agrobacterium tumefaciens 5A]|nr:hypothetical protein AT5A_16386 [Agrobacterium tumefaciens 5A]
MQLLQTLNIALCACMDWMIYQKKKMHGIGLI